MKQIHISLFLLFANIFCIYAQDNEDDVLHVESINKEGVKKESVGKCFALSFVKTAKLYSVILIEKEFILDSKEIKVFFNQKDNTNSLIFTIEADNKNIIKSEKLIAIPLIIIRQQLQNDNNVIYPVFTLEDFIPDLMKGITEKDVDNLKMEMEKWFNK